MNDYGASIHAVANLADILDVTVVFLAFGAAFCLGLWAGRWKPPCD